MSNKEMARSTADAPDVRFDTGSRMLTGAVYLGLGLGLVVLSRQLAGLNLWWLKRSRLETTDPEVATALWGVTRWAIIAVGVCFAAYGVKVLIVGS